MASGSVCGVAMFRCFQKADGANDIAREIWLLFTGAVLRVLRSSVVGLRDSELAIFTRKSKDATVCSLKIHETVKLTFPRQWYVTATRKRFFLKEAWIFYRNLHRKRTFNCRGAWTSPEQSSFGLPRASLEIDFVKHLLDESKVARKPTMAVRENLFSTMNAWRNENAARAIFCDISPNNFGNNNKTEESDEE